MKRMNVLLLSLMLCSAMMAAGCDNSIGVDDDIPQSYVPQAVMQSFNDKYPGSKATWEMERGMLKAEFRKDRRDVDAWFDNNGKWVRSETDLVARDLPNSIKTMLESTYPGYHIDDIDLIETPTEKYYLVELEKRGSMDIKVKVTEDGKIIS